MNNSLIGGASTKKRIDGRNCNKNGGTMQEVYERLWVGSDHDCIHEREGWAVVHACKHPCHQYAVGYRGNLSPHHPSYLVHEEANNLYLNMIDPDIPGYLQPRFMMPMIEATLRFTENHLQNGSNVLIHSNQGGSRAPSLAMLFLAKRIGCIDGTNFDNARADLVRIYPDYSPGISLATFLNDHWDEID
jgi:hypothetical protein